MGLTYTILIAVAEWSTRSGRRQLSFPRAMVARVSTLLRRLFTTQRVKRSPNFQIVDVIPTKALKVSLYVLSHVADVSQTDELLGEP